MANDSRLLVKLNVGHSSQLLQPPLPNGHTHRWTVYVKTHENEDFRDRSFVDKVVFQLHTDFPNYRRVVKDPPYQVTETGYAGFTIPLTISLAGNKQYKVNYDLNLTMEKRGDHRNMTTILVDEFTPGFYATAKKFGAERMKRGRENELLGLPGSDGPSSPPSFSPPPEKKRKKERSADVSASNSPAPIERLKERVDEREKDLRRAERSISQPNRSRKREEPGPDSKKKKENKLLDFVMDKNQQRPSPTPSPAVVEKLKREEKKGKKDIGKSASPSSSTSMVEKFKKEERKKEVRGSSPSTSTSAVDRLKEEKRKEKIILPSSEKEKKREKEKDKNGIAPSPPEKEKRKEKDAEKLPGTSLAEKQKEGKEKDRERFSSGSSENKKEEKEKRKEKEKAPSSVPSDSAASKREKERKGDKQKERDRSKDFRPPSSSSDRDKAEKERKDVITPPPVLLRQECAPSVSALIARSVSPPTLVPVNNGRAPDNPRASASFAYGSVGSTVLGHQSIGVTPIPSLLTSTFPHPFALQLAASSSGSHALQQPSPSGSQGGRETPSEKTSRSSISPGLRNEETASSGGSSASSHSSERRGEQKRIPKVAPSQRERDALSVPLASIDASTVRRRIDSLTDPDKIFEMASLLLDLDSSAQIISIKNASPSLVYDLSNMDQKDLLRLDSVLNGGGGS